MTEHTIHILTEHLANQIAAGEVVQRPESAVKELVENAIDAGATSVTVIVREAGKQLIHVIDNGVGMSKSDLELSIVRHATSKISTEDDLQSIQTLGFRGEAMASIAAIADVEIRTRRAHDETGWTRRCAQRGYAGDCSKFILQRPCTPQISEGRSYRIPSCKRNNAATSALPARHTLCFL